jgi:sugar lactone lactonase YvrE
VAPSGAVSIATAGCEYPNGLAFSPAERTLYVANTRTHVFIHAFDVHPDGDLTNHRFFASMSSPEGSVPDGMKVDAEGGIFCTGPGGTWVFDPSGIIWGRFARLRFLPTVPEECPLAHNILGSNLKPVRVLISRVSGVPTPDPYSRPEGSPISLPVPASGFQL